MDVTFKATNVKATIQVCYLACKKSTSTELLAERETICEDTTSFDAGAGSYNYSGSVL